MSTRQLPFFYDISYDLMACKLLISIFHSSPYHTMQKSLTEIKIYAR